MPSFTEKDMSAALQMVAEGMSVNKAAEANGINRSTLQGRIKGSTTPREAQKPRQKLSDIQEKHLRDWIIIQADLGCPVSHQQVREFASKIAVRNGFPEGVGKNWLQGFLGRNPDIRTLKGILYAPDDAGDTPSQAGEQIQRRRSWNDGRNRNERSIPWSSVEEVSTYSSAWFSCLDYNSRVYLSNRESPETYSHFQGENSPTTTFP